LDISTHDLDRKILQFPIRHLDALFTDKNCRIDRLSGSSVQQTPAQHLDNPNSSAISHRHYAGIAFAALSYSQQTTTTARNFQHSIRILNTYEEKLISKPKRQVLQEGRIKADLQPTLQSALCLRLNVVASRSPATGKLFRDLVHFNLVHGFAHNSNR
jgi:hypothetical protein